MYQKLVTAAEEGQRLDKLLIRMMPNAGSSFLYKMLRKKNIKLNHQKASGNEKLQKDDVIEIFFSDETLEKFMGSSVSSVQTGENAGASLFIEAYHKLHNIEIIYEDEDFLFLNKPTGVLSQKAKADDNSVNEWILGYLLEERNYHFADFKTFKPAVCNRLDRNTSGLILAAKSAKGAKLLGNLLKSRELAKYYLAYAKGEIKEGALLEGYIVKDEKNNKVFVSKNALPKSDYIKTAYKPIYSNKEYTLLMVHLITGKSHQIRAHLASIGHALLGDPKYGAAQVNQRIKNRFAIDHQMLHAYSVTFPETEDFPKISGKTFCTKIPEEFQLISGMKLGEITWQHGVQED